MEHLFLNVNKYLCLSETTPSRFYYSHLLYCGVSKIRMFLVTNNGVDMCLKQKPYYTLSFQNIIEAVTPVKPRAKFDFAHLAKAATEDQERSTDLTTGGDAQIFSRVMVNAGSLR